MMMTHRSAGAVLSVVFMMSASPCMAADDAGSMFDAKTYRSLVAENKASRIGDVLTVIVQEAASASSTVDLRAQRSFNLSARADSSTSSFPRSVSTGAETESDGVGRTQRSGRLLTQLSVRVTDINQNGDLIVAGDQSLRINGEQQLITLSGVVRPYDVSDSNTVLSTRIADARIQFHGKGFVASQSKPGWLARLFNLLGL